MKEEAINYIAGVCKECDMKKECSIYKKLYNVCEDNGIVIYVCGCFGDDGIHRKDTEQLAVERPACICESCVHNSSRKYFNCEYAENFKFLFISPDSQPSILDDDTIIYLPKNKSGVENLWLPKSQGVFFIIGCKHYKLYYAPTLCWCRILKENTMR